MRSVRTFLAAGFMAAGLGQPAQAEDVSTWFGALWAEFLNGCAPVIANPAQIDAMYSRPSSQPLKTLARTPDGNSSVVFHVRADFLASTYVHVIKSPSGYWVECEVSRAFAMGSDYGGLASRLRAILQASGQMTVAGGPMQDVPGGSTTLEALGDAPWDLIVVHGVFPGRQITTLVNVEGSGATIRVTGDLK